MLLNDLTIKPTLKTKLLVYFDVLRGGGGGGGGGTVISSDRPTNSYQLYSMDGALENPTEVY